MRTAFARGWGIVPSVEAATTPLITEAEPEICQTEGRHKADRGQTPISAPQTPPQEAP